MKFHLRPRYPWVWLLRLVLLAPMGLALTFVLLIFVFPGRIIVTTITELLQSGHWGHVWGAGWAVSLLLCLLASAAESIRLFRAALASSVIMAASVGAMIVYDSFRADGTVRLIIPAFIAAYCWMCLVRMAMPLPFRVAQEAEQIRGGQ